ncbi:hypothetical protein ES288_A03G073800v1 [Gossypium darwinii]|uniref:Uncharacterized protein n=1 Tax=Gossypium darwinii TaxID=34276 RepID=A0A5D2H3Q8_GOSDA|nr:hypothetical protein ES288_A03G073800v1 [Gossypium darwinii]
MNKTGVISGFSIFIYYLTYCLQFLEPDTLLKVLLKRILG